jgi:hypothetical protein
MEISGPKQAAAVYRPHGASESLPWLLVMFDGPHVTAIAFETEAEAQKALGERNAERAKRR